MGGASFGRSGGAGFSFESFFLPSLTYIQEATGEDNTRGNAKKPEKAGGGWGAGIWGLGCMTSYVK